MSRDVVAGRVVGVVLEQIIGGDHIVLGYGCEADHALGYDASFFRGAGGFTGCRDDTQLSPRDDMVLIEVEIGRTKAGAVGDSRLVEVRNPEGLSQW